MIKHVFIENKGRIAVNGVRPGVKKKIEVDDKGVPVDGFWRRRLKDSKIDGAFKIAQGDKKKKATGVLKIKKEELKANGK